MASKTPNSGGFTLIELIVVIGIVAVLATVAIVFTNPAEQRMKARDERRFADLTRLETAINEFRVSTGSYPDTSDTTRSSTSLPPGNVGPFENARSGWIKQDLSTYLSKLLTDPVNNSSLYYTYRHNSSGYELDARLEFYSDHAVNDGGNAAQVYEVGNNLSIL